MAGELGDGEVRATKERMGWATEQAEKFPIEPAIFQPGTALVDQADGKRGAPGNDFRDGELAGGHVYGDRCGGVSGVKRTQRVVEDRREHVACDRDPHMAADFLCYVAHQRAEPEDRPLNIDCLAIEKIARIGQVEVSGRSVDELAAQPGFEPLERTRHRRLLEPQPVGRRRHAAGLGERHEGAQEVPVQFARQALKIRIRRHYRFAL